MFNNVAFDVFIGLVLVFLLYSLLVTIIGEILATWMGLRSRILRVSIEKMLNDGYNQVNHENNQLDNLNGLWKRIKAFIQRYFLKEFSDFKESFAGRFYEYPAIKYLSNKAGEQTTFFSQTKPSYLTAEIFADTLIQLIKDKGTGADDMEKVGYSLKYNTHHIQLATLKHLQDMFDNSAGEIVKFKDKLKQWYNETQDRATGWYKRKLQLILFWLGFVIAIIFNVDTILIARILSKDKEARNQMVEIGVQLAKDTLRYQTFITPNGDTVRSQQLLDTSFARIQKDIDEANLVLGLGWPTGNLRKELFTGIDSIRNKENYQAIASSGYASLFVDLNNILDSAGKYSAEMNSRSDRTFRLIQQSLLDSLKFTISKLGRAPVLTGESPKADSTVGKDSASKDSIDKILSGKKIPTKDLSEKQDAGFLDSIHLRIDSLKGSLKQIQQSDTNILVLAKVTRKNLDHLKYYIDSIAGGHYANIDSVKHGTWKQDQFFVIYGKRKYTWYEKGWYVIKNTFNLARFIGFLITALMLSLGAPFWFDLLKKLVSLRGAGVKPEEKKEDPLPTQITTGIGGVDLVPKPLQPALPAPPLTGLALSVKLVKADLVTVKGIQSVEPGFIKINNTKIPAIEIYVEDDAARLSAFARVKDVHNGYPINYYVVTQASTHSFPTAEIGSKIFGNILRIGNISGALGFGTLGCFMRKKNSDRIYLISCWHVLKADPDWWASVGNLAIIDSNNQLIGRIADGTLSDTFDVGIAICTARVTSTGFNTALKIKGNWRVVTEADSVNEVGVHFCGNISGKRNAVVYYHAGEKSLKYPDHKKYILTDLFSITIRDAQGNPGSPSKEGDSGSVVVGDDGCPLGILIGGDDKFSYVAKFSNILAEDKPYRDYSIIV